MHSVLVVNETKFPLFCIQYWGVYCSLVPWFGFSVVVLCIVRISPIRAFHAALCVFLLVVHPMPCTKTCADIRVGCFCWGPGLHLQVDCTATCTNGTQHLSLNISTCKSVMCTPYAQRLVSRSRSKHAGPSMNTRMAGHSRPLRTCVGLPVW